MSAADRWGRHGDDYLLAGGFNGRGQLRRLAFAISDAGRCRGTSNCGTPLFRGRDCCAWKVGHHAGRIFAVREAARDAADAPPITESIFTNAPPEKLTLDAVLRAIESIPMRHAPTPTERFITTAMRTGTAYGHPSTSQEVRGALAAIGVDFVEHALLAPGQFIAVEPSKSSLLAPWEPFR